MAQSRVWYRCTNQRHSQRAGSPCWKGARFFLRSMGISTSTLGDAPTFLPRVATCIGQAIWCHLVVLLFLDFSTHVVPFCSSFSLRGGLFSETRLCRHMLSPIRFLAVSGRSIEKMDKHIPLGTFHESCMWATVLLCRQGNPFQRIIQIFEVR